jgi:hypothetical protein
MRTTAVRPVFLNTSFQPMIRSVAHQSSAAARKPLSVTNTEVEKLIKTRALTEIRLALVYECVGSFEKHGLVQCERKFSSSHLEGTLDGMRVQVSHLAILLTGL